MTKSVAFPHRKEFEGAISNKVNRFLFGNSAEGEGKDKKRRAVTGKSGFFNNGGRPDTQSIMKVVKSTPQERMDIWEIHSCGTHVHWCRQHMC